MASERAKLKKLEVEEHNRRYDESKKKAAERVNRPRARTSRNSRLIMATIAAMTFAPHNDEY